MNTSPSSPPTSAADDASTKEADPALSPSSAAVAETPEEAKLRNYAECYAACMQGHASAPLEELIDSVIECGARSEEDRDALAGERAETLRQLLCERMCGDARDVAADEGKAPEKHTLDLAPPLTKGAPNP